MIADPDFDAPLDKRLRDIGLDIRKTDCKIRLERDDVIDFGRKKRGDFRLFSPRPRRPYRKSGNTDNAVFLTQCIENFGGLFGKTNNALWIDGSHGRV